MLVAFAIGFAEANEEGKRLQDQIVAIAHNAGMAILGPNCQGLINSAKPVSYIWTTLRIQARPSRIPRPKRLGDDGAHEQPPWCAVEPRGLERQ